MSALKGKGKLLVSGPKWKFKNLSFFRHDGITSFTWCGRKVMRLIFF